MSGECIVLKYNKQYFLLPQANCHRTGGSNWAYLGLNCVPFIAVSPPDGVNRSPLQFICPFPPLYPPLVSFPWLPVHEQEACVSPPSTS